MTLTVWWHINASWTRVRKPEDTFCSCHAPNSPILHLSGLTLVTWHPLCLRISSSRSELDCQHPMCMALESTKPHSDLILTGTDWFCGTKINPQMYALSTDVMFCMIFFFFSGHKTPSYLFTFLFWKHHWWLDISLVIFAELTGRLELAFPLFLLHWDTLIFTYWWTSV